MRFCNSWATREIIMRVKKYLELNADVYISKLGGCSKRWTVFKETFIKCLKCLYSERRKDKNNELNSQLKKF